MYRVRTIVLALVMLATGVYFVLYLYGWEWYRAFVVGVVFLAAEVAAGGARISSVVRASSVPAPPVSARPAPGRPAAGEGRVAGGLPRRPYDANGANGTDGMDPAGSADAERAVAEVLRATPPAYPDTFRWLRPHAGRMPVFIPLLLGAGVLMSAIAWVMERLAGVMYGGRIDASVARMAAPLMPPEDLLDRPTSTGRLGTPGGWERWAARADEPVRRAFRNGP